MDIKCKHCGRFLFKQMGTIVLEGIICPNNSCKAKQNFKIIGDHVQDIRHKFINPETEPKTKAPITNDDAAALTGSPEVS